MNTKYLVAAAAMVLAMSAWANPKDVYQCDGEIKDTSIIPTIVTPRCGEAVQKHERSMYNFIDQDGRPYVARATILASVRCEGGICAEVVQGQFGEALGTAPDGFYYVQRGYYLDRDSLGRTVAYRMGTGPQYSGSVAVASPGTTNATKLYCSGMSDTCTLTVNGKAMELPREQLPQHASFYSGDLSDCIAEACWGNKGEFLGLNPDYFQH